MEFHNSHTTEILSYFQMALTAFCLEEFGPKYKIVFNLLQGSDELLGEFDPLPLVDWSIDPTHRYKKIYM